MNPAQLSDLIAQKQSLLCVGLDPDPARIPAALQGAKDPVLDFNKAVIDATAPYAVAYKPNLAFYEAAGPRGWDTLAATRDHIPPGTFTIADAKRGDIGNTSSYYAKAFFEVLGFDAITVAPYMGADSVKPFLEYPGKWVFLLALTSNPGAEDFQWHRENGLPLYEKVITTALKWAEGMPGHLGFVTGATRPDQLAQIRALAPDSVFLVPGVGAQGGDLDAVCKSALTPSGGLLINASRSILYASSGPDFAEAARKEAQTLQASMASFLP